MAAIVGMNSRSDLHFQRNLAQWRRRFADAFAGPSASCQRLGAQVGTPRPAPHDHVRNPDFHRSGPAMGQPVLFSSECAEKCRNRDIPLVETACSVDLLAIENLNKGKTTCLTNLGSSLLQLLSLWLVAWKLTCSVARLVQLLARLPLTHLAQTKQQQHLLVQLLACSATTLASAAKRAKNFRATLARHTIMNSRQGPSLTAVLRSKDMKYV